MAFMYRDPSTGVETGPYPCDVGEYCGNHHRSDSGYRGYRGYKDLSANDMTDKRFGRPRPTKYHTSKQMADMGYVGLYRTKARVLDKDYERWVPTPESLTEPAE